MGFVTSALLAVVGAGMLLVAWMAYRTADETPAAARGWAVLWACVAVLCAGAGVWLAWASAFILAEQL